MDLKVGDFVDVRYTTPSGKAKQFEGEVTEIKNDKVRVKYETGSITSRSLSFQVREVWRHRDQCTRIKKLKGGPVGRQTATIARALAANVR